MAGSSFKLGKPFSSVNSIVSSNSTTTLLNTSDYYQYITGSNAHTIKLPDATTMPKGSGFAIVNGTASNNIIVIDNGNNVLETIGPGLSIECAVDNNSTANGIRIS